MTCCGVCDRLLVECECTRCACGHCRHDHEKWRWHRLCKRCTPIAYSTEFPNEIDGREAPHNFDEPPFPDYGAELDKHRPENEPPLTCCAERSAQIRARNQAAEDEECARAAEVCHDPSAPSDWEKGRR